MFSSLLAAPCELKVSNTPRWRASLHAHHPIPLHYQLHLLQNTIYLRPPTIAPTEDAPPTSNDEVARGMVELFVPNDRKIGGIRVKLRAVQSVAILPEEVDTSYGATIPVGWEDTVLMEKVVEIGLPRSKSHATIPGDDVANTAEHNRGRSRATRSRNATPSTSRATSPTLNAPPEYQEEEEQSHAETSTTSISGLGSAFARAMSRGRQTGSRTPSQPNSRSASRAASRNTSPSRPSSGATTPTVANSPQLGSTPLAPSPSTNLASLPRLSSNGTLQVQRSESGTTLLPSPGEDYDVSPLGATLSRTGLSNGRSQASGAHAHANDREDRYGVVPPVHGVFARGRGGIGSDMTSSAASARSATMSPSRGFGRRGRDESKSRLLQMGKKAVRSPSVDTGVAESSSSATEDTGGLDLQKGVHGFEFAFIIPADSAPYERSPYGRVRYIIKATAFGAGRAKSNLEAWRDLIPVVNPSPEGGPTALTILYNDLHPTVGLISIACTSNNISVGGIFNVDIHSPTPPEDLIVYLVRVSIETTVELRTRKKGKQRVPAFRNKLFEKGWVPPRPNDPHGPGDGKKSEGLVRDPTRPGCRSDDAWTVQGVARMPNDNVVRSSTLPRTRAAIRFTHSLLVEVVHSRESAMADEERKLKVFALRQPIVLPSCCVAYDAVSLPAYTPDYDGDRPSAMPYDLASHGQQGMLHHRSSDSGDAARNSSQTRSASRSRWISTAAPANALGHDFCVCGQSIQDLSERERTLMPAVPHAELPLDGLSHRKIGELPESTGRNSNSTRAGSTLRRSLSRSSTNSTGSKRSISRSLSRVRSPSSHRPNVIGAGERGEGSIHTMSRGSRQSELPGEAQGHHITGITNPPTYHDIVNEEENEEDQAVLSDDRGRLPRREEVEVAE